LLEKIALSGCGESTCVNDEAALEMEKRMGAPGIKRATAEESIRRSRIGNTTSDDVDAKCSNGTFRAIFSHAHEEAA
jgi:hypothetical protein